MGMKCSRLKAVCGGVRGAYMVTAVLVTRLPAHPCHRIEWRAASEDSHLRGGMDAFHWRKNCARKRSREDPFVVAMKRGTETVGHVPCTISYVCTLFLRQRGSISCEVTGSSRPSVDLSPF